MYRFIPFISLLRGRCFVAVVILFFTALQASAQTDTTKSNPPVVSDSLFSEDTAHYRINKTYLKSYWTDFKAVVTSPARWDGRDWRNLGITMGIAGLLFASDYEIKKTVMANQNHRLYRASEILYPFGNTLSPAILGGLYVTALITKNRKIESAAIKGAKSVVISTFFYTLSKATFPRKRPTYTNSPFVFSTPFIGKWEYTSFPSGHCNTVFSIATALAIEFKKTKWVPIVSYSIASLTGLSRIYQNRHWASDVFLGSAMGYFITKTIYAVEQKKIKRTLPSFN